MATTILPFTDYDFEINVEDGSPVFTFSNTNPDTVASTSYYTTANKLTLSSNVSINGDGSPIYPLCQLMINGIIIEISDDLYGQFDTDYPDTPFIISIEVGKMIELFVGDRLIERYDVEWLNDNIIMVQYYG